MEEKAGGGAVKIDREDGIYEDMVIEEDIISSIILHHAEDRKRNKNLFKK